MDTRHKLKIKRSYNKLVDGLTCVMKLCDHLIQDDVMTIAESERVKAEITTDSTNRTFLNILLCKGPAAYPSFLASLRATGQDHVIERLETLRIDDEDVRRVEENQGRNFTITEVDYYYYLIGEKGLFISS